MRTSSDLSKLYYSIRRRLIKFGLLYRGYSELHNPAVIAYLTVEIDNMIKSSLREFVVSSLLATRTRGGNRVGINRLIDNQEQAYAFILSVMNVVRYNRMNSPLGIPFRDCPTIRNDNDVFNVLRASSSSNLGSVERSRGYNFTFFDEISTVRNFYAHRNKDTFGKVIRRARRMGIAGLKHADELLLMVLPGRPVPVFEDWLYDIGLFFDELTM